MLRTMDSLVIVAVLFCIIVPSYQFYSPTKFEFRAVITCDMENGYPHSYSDEPLPNKWCFDFSISVPRSFGDDRKIGQSALYCSSERTRVVKLVNTVKTWKLSYHRFNFSIRHTCHRTVLSNEPVYRTMILDLKPADVVAGYGFYSVVIDVTNKEPGVYDGFRYNALALTEH